MRGLLTDENPWFFRRHLKKINPNPKITTLYLNWESPWNSWLSLGAYVNAQMTIRRLSPVPFALLQSNHWENLWRFQWICIKANAGYTIILHSTRQFENLFIFRAKCSLLMDSFKMKPIFSPKGSLRDWLPSVIHFYMFCLLSHILEDMCEGTVVYKGDASGACSHTTGKRVVHQCWRAWTCPVPQSVSLSLTPDVA